jgi:hypothetical protein
MNAGKWLILGTLTVALGAGVAAWTHRYYRTDAVQAFWGEQTLDLIANAPEVGALRWSDSQSDHRDATRAKGMLNVRYMLGSDFAYVWPADKKAQPDSSAWGLNFHGGSENLLLEFGPDCSYAWDRKSGKVIRLVPPAAENLRSFFEERFENQADGAGQSSQTPQ